MSPIKKAVLFLLLLFSIPLGLILYRPEFVLAALLRSSASELGYDIVSMRVSQLRPGSTTLDQLSLLSDEQQLDFSNMVVRYSPSGLLRGQIESVQVDLTEIGMRPSPQQAVDNTEETLASILESFDQLVVGNLVFERIRVSDPVNGIAADLSLQSPPLHFEGRAEFTALPDAFLEFTANRTDDSEMQLEARLVVHDELAIESEASIQALASSTAVRANSVVSVEALRVQLDELLPAATELRSARLDVGSEFEIRQLLGDPDLSSIVVVIESPDSALQIAQSSDFGESAMTLELPLRLTGELSTGTGELRLKLNEVSGMGSWTFGNDTIHLETGFADTELRCTSFTNCDLLSSWHNRIVQWRMGEYSGEDINVSSQLRLNYANDEMRLATDLIEIEIPQVNSSASDFVIATTLRLNELELRAGDVISGGFNFESTELQLDSPLLNVTNPAYSGKLQLEDDVLTGIVELDLDQRMRLGIGLQHFLLRDTGDVVIQLASHAFSEEQPLSSLVAPKQLNADIVAGQVEALFNISWSKQQDESWRFGGPIALKLERLSGFYEDYLFVDLDTDLFAEATTPLGIQVTNPASASLGRIDVGLPLENLAWQYRFDTLTSELQINDFKTELLGGTLSIPALRYNPDRERQQMDVILADLAVEELVALAEYPGVYADGLISGYLPFIIEGDTLTIERGLVGALNPGGNIRYTPASPTPSSNPSLRLVNEALSNYQYRTMNTEVFYDEQGELLLQVQLHGRNPDMNSGQEINLNVNITDNIPSLLESLQASRVITDELERFVQQP